jgi:large subunit ribosomal protein L1
MAKKTAPDAAQDVPAEGAAPKPSEEKKAKPDKEAKAPPAEAKGEVKADSAVKPVTASTEPAKKRKRPGRAPRRGKKLRNQLKNVRQRVTREGAVPLKKAVALLKQIKRAKFDETVEVHMWLGIDPTQSDQMIRGSVPLPHGLGKVKRVLVFCQGDNVGKAKEAGADFAGSDDMIERIQKEGWLDFDVALATQDMMGKVSRLGKVLGPRGLMPTPKAGTVIPAGGDVAQAVREQKAGKVEYRSDKGGNVHAGVGKMSFDDDKLADNLNAFIEQIRAVKPAGVKGNYVRSITIAGTMTLGVPVAM